MDIVKGASGSVVCTVYSIWTGETSTSTVANLTGASVLMSVKRRDSDSDANAIWNKSGVITDAINGLVMFPILATDTNLYSYSNLFFEVIAKMADGVTYYRSGSQPFNIKPNIYKTLF